MTLFTGQKYILFEVGTETKSPGGFPPGLLLATGR
jgi:hypothetical protein